MEDYPKTLIEFEKRFGTEEACLEYLGKIRWPRGFQCPKCGHQKAWLTNRGLYHCVHCSFQASVIAGTIFQDSKKPLGLWGERVGTAANAGLGQLSYSLDVVAQTAVCHGTAGPGSSLG